MLTPVAMGSGKEMKPATMATATTAITAKVQRCSRFVVMGLSKVMRSATTATPKTVIIVPPIVRGATVCGDGLIQGDEVCDDGSNNADAWSMSRHCNATCTGWAGYCGDGTKQAEEFCDQGSGSNSNAYAGGVAVCNVSCDGYAPFCGDGDRTGDEVCDEGNLNADGYNSDLSNRLRCLGDCTDYRPHCGDGLLQVESGEKCDDGNTENGDACGADCQSYCGDGVIDGANFELCDDGTDNSDDWSLERRCNLSCSGFNAFCGDGVVSMGEECNDGNAEDDLNGCSATCQRYGIVHSADSALVWKMCAQGMDYITSTQSCIGSPTVHRYCDPQGNDCNQGFTGGVLDGEGNSHVWNTCHDMTYAGYNDWRVPIDELRVDSVSRW